MHHAHASGSVTAGHTLPLSKTLTLSMPHQFFGASCMAIIVIWRTLAELMEAGAHDVHVVRAYAC